LSIGEIHDSEANGAINYYSNYVPNEISSNDQNLKLFYCTDHDSMFPTPPASIVVAENEKSAITMLDEELSKRGCKIYGAYGYSLTQIDLTTAQAIVLTTGAPS